MAGMFSFEANDPESYDAMTLRQRIAMQMMKEKAHPKNVGEGLSSMGKDIGEGMMMMAMLKKQAALEANDRRSAEGAPRDGSYVPGTSTAPPASTTPPPAEKAAKAWQLPNAPQLQWPSSPAPATGPVSMEDPGSATDVAGLDPDAFTPEVPGPTSVDTAAATQPPPEATPAPEVMANANPEPITPTRVASTSEVPPTMRALMQPQGDPNAATPTMPPAELQPPPPPSTYAPPPASLAARPMTADIPAAQARIEPTAPPAAGAGDPSGQWGRYSRGLAGIESGGAKNPYDLIGARTRSGDRAIGKYQIMGANVPSWTKAALGRAMTPAEFRASPEAQEATAQHRFMSYVDKYGEEGAARAWYAGEGGMKNLGATDVHGRLTVAGYGKDFLNRIGGDGGSAPTNVASAPQGPTFAPGSEPTDRRDAIAQAVMQQQLTQPQQAASAPAEGQEPPVAAAAPEGRARIAAALAPLPSRPGGGAPTAALGGSSLGMPTPQQTISPMAIPPDDASAAQPPPQPAPPPGPPMAQAGPPSPSAMPPWATMTPGTPSGIPVAPPAAPAIGKAPDPVNVPPPSAAPIPPGVNDPVPHPGEEPKRLPEVGFSPAQQYWDKELSRRDLTPVGRAHAQKMFEREEGFRQSRQAIQDATYTHERQRWEAKKDAYDTDQRTGPSQALSTLKTRVEIEKAQNETALKEREIALKDAEMNRQPDVAAKLAGEVKELKLKNEELDRQSQFGKQLGGLPKEVTQKIADEYITKKHPAVVALAQSQPAIRMAREALQGAITGVGANQRVAWAQVLSALGIRSAGNDAADSQLFKAYIQPVVNAQRVAAAGNNNISDRDMMSAEQSAGKDLTLEPQALSKLLNHLEETTIENLKFYDANSKVLFGDSPAARAAFGAPKYDTELQRLRAPADGSPVQVWSTKDASRYPSKTKIILPDGRYGEVP